MVISERIRAKLVGIAEECSFCWLEEKTSKKDRLLCYKYYNGFKLNSQTYREGDCVLINIGSFFCNNDEKYDVARIIECFDNGTKGYKGFVKVQWFTRTENIRKAHKNYFKKVNFPQLDEDIELVRDTWTYEDDVDVETIAGHCWVEEVTADCEPSKVKRPANALGPLYICRFIYQKSCPHILPIIESSVYKAEKSPLALREITNSPKTCKDSPFKLKKQSEKKNESKYSDAKNQLDSPLGTRRKSVSSFLVESRRSVKRKLLAVDEEDEKDVSMKKRRKEVDHNHENAFSKMPLLLTPEKENKMSSSKSLGRKKNGLIEMSSLLTPKKENSKASPKSLKKNKIKEEMPLLLTPEKENKMSSSKSPGRKKNGLIEMSSLLTPKKENSKASPKSLKKNKIKEEMPLLLTPVKENKMSSSKSLGRKKNDLIEMSSSLTPKKENSRASPKSLKKYKEKEEMPLLLTPEKENKISSSKSPGRKKNGLIEMPSLLTLKKENNKASPKSLEKNKKKEDIVKSPSNKIENIKNIGQCRGLQQTEISELLSDEEDEDDESLHNRVKKLRKYKIQKGFKHFTCSDDGIQKSSRKKTKPNYNELSSDDDFNGVRRSSRKIRKPLAYMSSSDDENEKKKQCVVYKKKSKNKKEDNDLTRLPLSPSKAERTPKKSEHIKNNSNTPRRSLLKIKLDRNEIKSPEVVKNLIINDISTPRSRKKSSKYSESTPKSSKKISNDSIATPKSRKKVSDDIVSTPNSEKNNKSKLSEKGKTPKSTNKTRFSNNLIEECKSEFEQAKAQLHVSAVPSYLPCREDEFQQIFSFVEGKLLDSTGGCMYVSGVPGTGKTATVREVVRTLKDCEENGTVPIFQFLEVNAMKLTKPHQLWVEIWEGISGNRVSPEHSFSLFEKWLKSSSGPKRKSVFLLLDELDLLWTKKQDVMFNLFDLSTRIDSRLIVVTIANTMDLPERMMISRVSSRLGLTRMTFQPYTFKQLQEIITSRLQGIKAFDSDAIQLVARKVAAVSGDARRALDICRRATELGELKKTEIISSPLKSPKKENFLVGMTHVTMAISEMFSSPKITAIRECSQTVKYLLQAIMMEFTRTGIEEAQLMKVLEHLQSICRLDGLPPPSFSDSLKLINVLSAQKIIFTEHSRLDMLLRIRLNISTEDVSYALSLDKS